MNADGLLAHYERIADSPDAIARLRRFILDLAMRGKLVPQDPTEEPASELLKRFGREKARLVKIGEIRNPKILSPVRPCDGPGEEIPGWAWVYLGDVSTLITKGSTPTSYGHAYTANGVKFIKVESIKHGCLLPENILSFISKETHEFLARSRLQAGDILFSIAGSIGTCAVVTDEILPASTNQALAIIRGTQTVFFPGFLLKSLRSSVSDSVLAKARGGAMNNVSLHDIQHVVVPLPPLAEQHRIVAKVDELMALCDRLEAARGSREATRDRLAAASLARLNAPDPATFHDDARFALDALPALTTRPDQIKHLRQTILNLAVRGKLVPQDAGDEPASVLLTKISKVRRDLIATKSLRQSTEATSCVSNRDLIEIPSDWAWAKADQIMFITKLAGFEYTKHFNLKPSGEIPVVRAQNVRPWKLDPSNLLYMEEKVSAILERSALTKPCLLITFIGAGIGDVAHFKETKRWHLAPNVAKAELLSGSEEYLELRYLLLFLISPFGRAEIFKHMKATAQPSLSMGTIRDIDFAVPPLAEQHRIVAKVDELMALCDRLEASLTVTSATRRRLLDALLAEALGPADARTLAAAE